VVMKTWDVELQQLCRNDSLVEKRRVFTDELVDNAYEAVRDCCGYKFHWKASAYVVIGTVGLAILSYYFSRWCLGYYIGSWLNHKLLELCCNHKHTN
jgi:hypothetical protein